MSEKYKKNSTATECDPQTASTLAASSLAHYFKEKQWKIISFFPNVSCRKDSDDK